MRKAFIGVVTVVVGGLLLLSPIGWIAATLGTVVTLGVAVVAVSEEGLQ